MKMSKENKIGNEDNWYSDHGVEHEDTDKSLTSGLVTYREAKGIVCGNIRFAR
jgi:hypothetical protein